jgi:hypothetical protein
MLSPWESLFLYFISLPSLSPQPLHPVLYGPSASVLFYPQLRALKTSLETSSLLSPLWHKTTLFNSYPLFPGLLIPSALSSAPMTVNGMCLYCTCIGVMTFFDSSVSCFYHAISLDNALSVSHLNFYIFSLLPPLLKVNHGSRRHSYLQAACNPSFLALTYPRSCAFLESISETAHHSCLPPCNFKPLLRKRAGVQCGVQCWPSWPCQWDPPHIPLIATPP